MDFVPDPRRKLYIETTGVCNLACRFCAYGKKRSGKVSMDLPRFRDTVEQATAMGFRQFGLTPLTGEPFMDRGLLDKLRLLDEHPEVDAYHFYTNLVPPSFAQIEALADLRKLAYLHVSVYGHDRDSFVRVTRRRGAAYTRLVANLERLLTVFVDRGCSDRVKLGLRTTGDLVRGREPQSELAEILARWAERLGQPIPVTRTYNNWGGLINEDDVRGLGITLGSSPPKRGPCALIFYKLIVLADGRVNACACRDVDGTLVIGDVREQPLAWILSGNNPAYTALVQEQMAGRFRSVCDRCDFYQSVRMRNAPLESFRGAPDYRSLSETLVQLGFGPEGGRGGSR